MSLADLRVSRHRVLVGAGLGLVATVLAACTTYGKKPEASAEAPASAGDTASGDAGGRVLARTSEVPVGSGVIVDDVVITQPTAGDFKGFSATCTHAGCTVNKVADGTIQCPCHGSKFNLDGSVANGPAAKPLEPQIVAVEGDSIIKG
jgi:Rieske Fe-S protein